MRKKVAKSALDVRRVRIALSAAVAILALGVLIYLPIEIFWASSVSYAHASRMFHLYLDIIPLAIISIAVYFLISYQIRNLIMKEQALAATERKFSRVAEVTPDLVFELDEQFRIVFANPAVAVALGVPRKALYGDKGALRKFVHPEDFSKLTDFLGKLKDKPERSGKILIRLKDSRGQDIFVNFSVAFLELEDEGKSVYELVGNQLTELIEKEEELRKSEEKHRMLLQSIGSPVIAITKDLTVLYCNEGFADILGFAVEEVEGKKLTDIFPAVEQIPSLSNWLTALKGSFDTEVETSYAGRFYRERIFKAPWGILVIAEDITEKKIAEEKLRRTERRLSTILDNVPNIVLYETGGGREFISSNIYDLIGYTSEELTRDRTFFPSLIHPDDRERIGKLIRQWHDEGEPSVLTLQFRVKRADGKYIWIEDHMVEVKPEGEKKYMAGVMVDITDRKDAEAKILHLNRLYEVLSKVSLAIVEIRERDDLFQEVCEILVDYGKLRMAWIGMVEEESGLVKPVAFAGDAEEYVRKIKVSSEEDEYGRGPTGRAIREGKHYICNDFFSDPDTKPWHEQAQKANFKSSAAFPIFVGGKVVGALNVYAPVTNYFDEDVVELLHKVCGSISIALENIERYRQRQEFEKALRESEQRYRQLFDDVPLGICVHTDRIVVANRELARLMGFKDAGELKGKCLFDFVDESMRDKLKTTLQRSLIKSNKVSFLDCKFKGREKEFLAEVSGASILFGGKPACLIFLRDISDIRDMQEIIMRTQKLDAVGNLAAGMAHDFNNTLTALLGRIYAIRKELSEDEVSRDSIAKHVEIMESVIDKTTGITKRLLAISSSKAIGLKVLELNTIIKETAELLKATIRENISFSLKLDPEANEIIGDASLVEQVILNLAINACDAMPDGGNLLISTEKVTIDEDYCKSRPDASPGQYARITVTDTGVGISKENLKRIFEPFFTTKPSGKGTGLGLAITYGSVKQMKGFIHVYSELNKGTTFSVYLPLAKEKPKVKKPVAKVSDVKGNEVVVFAEDEKLINEILTGFLNRHGYKVYPAKDGQEAIEKIHELKGKVDIVVTDTVMPRKDGYALYREAMELNPQIKFLFTSGYGSFGPEDDFLLESGVDFIAKPYSPLDLARKIRQILDKSP